jgi:hypothetical protein
VAHSASLTTQLDHLLPRNEDHDVFARPLSLPTFRPRPLKPA